jgi:nucleotide-binding universal stress UspA family protein
VFRQIMTPLDGSPTAERALPYAAQVAAATGASLHLVRVVDPPIAGSTTAAQPVPPVGAAEAVRAAEAEAAGYLDALRARPELGGMQVQVRVPVSSQPGAAAATLLDYERDAGIDLVVATTHGRTGLDRFALGSVAAHLLRYGTASLLLLRAFGQPASLTEVVVPLDGSVPAEWALRVVDELGGTVVRQATLLEVIAREERPQAEGYLASVAARLQKAGLTYHQRVESGDPAQAILELAGDTRLVVMATRGRTGLTRWPLGTVADRVAHSGEVSVWLVRAEWEPNSG